MLFSAFSFRWEGPAGLGAHPLASPAIRSRLRKRRGDKAGAHTVAASYSHTRVTTEAHLTPLCRPGWRVGLAERKEEREGAFALATVLHWVSQHPDDERARPTQRTRRSC